MVVDSDNAPVGKRTSPSAETLSPKNQYAVTPSPDLEDIDHKRHDEVPLTESGDRFRQALSSGAITVYEQDRDLRYRWLHPADGFGTAAIGKTDLDLLPPPEAELHTRLKLSVLESGKGVRREVSANFDGQNRWFDLLLEPRFDRAGNVVGLGGTALDITERRRAEIALNESEERFRGTFENAAVGIAHVHLDGRWMSVNDKFCDIVGYSRKELLSLSFEDITHPDDLAEDLDRAQGLLDGEYSNYSIEKRYIRNDGSPVWVNLTGSVYRDINGSPRYFIAVVQDITERKHAEAKIETANYRFRVAEEAVKGFNYDWNLETGVVSRSLGVERVSGYKRGEIPMTWQGWTDLIHPKDRMFESETGAIEFVNRLEGDTSGADYRIRHKDGHYIWVLERNVLIRGTDGHVRRMIGQTVDITERKEAADRLLEAERRAARDYQRLLGRISPLAQTIGTSRNLNTICRAVVDFIRLEMPCDALIVSFYNRESRLKTAKYVWHNGQELDAGKLRPVSVSDSEPADRAISLGRSVVTDGEITAAEILQIETHYGNTTPILSIIAPMIVMGQVTGTIAVWNNAEKYRPSHITVLEMTASLAAVAIENIRLMTLETEARKLAEEANRSKDDFLAVLSHELRTPLHAMKGWVSLLKKGALGEVKQAHAIEVIARSVNAQNDLIEDILDVSRIISGKLLLEREQVSLVSIVSNAVEDARPAAEARLLNVVAELSPEADEMVGDALRLHQIVNNLLNNAIKFTSSGGEIAVHLARRGETAVLSVADTGVGIDADVLPQIFDRFKQADSSSRRRHGGLGLGLAIVDHLVGLHGGRISAISEKGRGSEFIVELPLTERQTESQVNAYWAAAEQKDHEDLQLAGLRLLIVEDDSDSLEMLRVTLEHSGARITALTSPVQAIEALEAATFDLMVSDLGMPEMDGHDLIDAVRNKLGIAPNEMPAIALSGYASTEDRERSLASGYQMHLAKPAHLSTLAAEILSLMKNRSKKANDRQVDHQ